METQILMAYYSNLITSVVIHLTAILVTDYESSILLQYYSISPVCVIVLKHVFVNANYQENLCILQICLSGATQSQHRF